MAMKLSKATVKEWEDATPKKEKKKLPYHVKKATDLGKQAALERFNLR
jgi:hypothetical protein